MSASGTWRKDIETLADEFGCVLDTTSRRHWVVRHPSGWFVFVSRTPSDPRALQYVRSDCRRKASGVWR